MAGDSLNLAKRNEAEATAWIAKVSNSMRGDDADALKGHLTMGNALLARPGVSKDTRAQLHQMVSGAHGRLAELKIDQITNGKAAYRQIDKAFGLGSDNREVATAFARTISAFTDLPWYKRKGVETGLWISTKTECNRASKALAAFPDDAIAQLTRKKLATWSGDKATVAQADQAIADLEKSNPAALEWARRELSADGTYAAKEE